jgi:hypothetical protein
MATKERKERMGENLTAASGNHRRACCRPTFYFSESFALFVFYRGQ